MDHYICYGQQLSRGAGVAFGFQEPDGRYSLETVKLPGSLKKIGAAAFRLCKKLRTVILPEGLVIIGDSAFASTPLESVHIPKSVKEIGSKAFDNCSELKDFYISDKTEKIGAEILGNYDSNSWKTGKPSGIRVHTPSGSKAQTYMEQYGGVDVVNDYANENA